MSDVREIKKLSEVCDFQNGFAFKSNKFKSDGLPILRISNIQNNHISTKDLVFFDVNDYKEDFERYKVLKNDIIIAMSGGTTGKIGINQTDNIYYLNQRVGKFSPKKNLDRQYLFYFLHTKSEESLKIAGGAAQPNLSTEQIKNFQIPVPSITKQRTIVAKLDQAFAAINQAKANIEKNIVNAKELFQSKLVDLFQNYDKTKFEVKTIKEITSLLGDGLHGTPKYNDNGEYYFINGNNLMDEGIVIKPNTKRIDESQYLKYKKDLNENTVLVSINGTLGNVGFYNNEKVVLGKSACYFNLKKDYDKRYIMYQIKSPIFLRYAHKEATGATIKNVSLKSMRNFEVIIPKDQKIQNQIVVQLDQLQEQTNLLVTKYQQKLANLEELKKSILEKAFKGELVV